MKVWEASIHLTFPTKASCMETSADSTDSRPSIQTVCAILLASCRIWGKTGSTLEAGRMRAVVCDVKVHKQNPTETNPTKQNPTNKIQSQKEPRAKTAGAAVPYGWCAQLSFFAP